MEDNSLLLWASMGSASAIGAVTAWIFGGSAWIGALVGAGILTVFFLGFWLAIYLIIVGLAELFKGGE